MIIHRTRNIIAITIYRETGPNDYGAASAGSYLIN